METTIEKFRRRLGEEWLPSFCDARERYFPDGFRWETASRVSEFDARWFMAAIDTGVVSHSGGFFMAAKSWSKEQIFSSGPVADVRRSFTLWTEPIITIGALARLALEFGWPPERLGCQSKGGSLDLVSFSAADHPLIGCEVKKSAREVDDLLERLHLYGADPSLVEPPPGSARNAWRKASYLRRFWPPLFWALGPEGRGTAFRIDRDGESERFALVPVGEGALRYGGQ